MHSLFFCHPSWPSWPSFHLNQVEMLLVADESGPTSCTVSRVSLVRNPSYLLTWTSDVIWMIRSCLPPPCKHRSSRVRGHNWLDHHRTQVWQESSLLGTYPRDACFFNDWSYQRQEDCHAWENLGIRNCPPDNDCFYWGSMSSDSSTQDADPHPSNGNKKLPPRSLLARHIPSGHSPILNGHHLT